VIGAKAGHREHDNGDKSTGDYVINPGIKERADPDRCAELPKELARDTAFRCLSILRASSGKFPFVPFILKQDHRAELDRRTFTEIRGTNSIAPHLPIVLSWRSGQMAARSNFHGAHTRLALNHRLKQLPGRRSIGVLRLAISCSQECRCDSLESPALKSGRRICRLAGRRQCAPANSETFADRDRRAGTIHLTVEAAVDATLRMFSVKGSFPVWSGPLTRFIQNSCRDITPPAGNSPTSPARRFSPTDSTLQGRVPKELALAGITTVESANTWLRDNYISAHNARFATKAEQEGSVFVAVAGLGLAETPMFPLASPIR
jgi:hypothetical protein